MKRRRVVNRLPNIKKVYVRKVIRVGHPVEYHVECRSTSWCMDHIPTFTTYPAAASCAAQHRTGEACKIIAESFIDHPRHWMGTPSASSHVTKNRYYVKPARREA